MSKLFEPYTLGEIQLKNRVVMAPMTRSRAIGNVPGDLIAQYYAQRASAGLIVTEGTSPSPDGLGYARIPGLFNKEQVSGWRKVTDAVHAKGGRIFVQLMHTGRVSHPANMPTGARVLAPSPIALEGLMWTDSEGQQAHPVPQEMTEANIKHAVQEFIRASEFAIEAGFDGVELHAANGYLLEQFLNPASNQRQDKYGGSPEKRMRFVLEIAAAVAARIGGERVGIRLSPYGTFNGMAGEFEGLEDFYATLAAKLSALGLVYVHVIDHGGEAKHRIRENFKGTYILAQGYDAERAEADLREGKGDLVAFGKPFLANPDLVRKLRERLPLAEADFSKLYTPGPEGFTSYEGAR